MEEAWDEGCRVAENAKFGEEDNGADDTTVNGAGDAAVDATSFREKSSVSPLSPISLSDTSASRKSISSKTSLLRG